VEVGAGQPVRVALVEVAPHSDVAVGQGEQRFGFVEQFEIQPGLADPPGLDWDDVLGRAHGVNNSARSVTTMSAPLRRNASACPTRSTPTTRPKPPARPAATPDSASSNTAPSCGGTCNSSAARRNESGAGLPGSCSSRMVTPSTRYCTKRSNPVTSSICRPFALDVTTATPRPASTTAAR